MRPPHASWAQHYDQAYRRSFGEFYERLTAATVECVAEFAPPPARIVDYGAGTGRLALPLTKAGYTVVATDPCAEMLAVLRAKAEAEQLAVPTVCCRMQDTFPSPPFDLALCVFTVLLYLLDEAALDGAFQSAATMLRPRGRLMIDIPSRQVFASYDRAAPDFVRTVRVVPESDCLFRYKEELQVREGGRIVNLEDSFLIRYWESAEVFDALGRAGFEVERDLSGRFAGSGSSYYVACLKSDPKA